MKKVRMSVTNGQYSNFEDFFYDFPVKKIITAALFVLGAIFIVLGFWKGYKNRIDSSWSFIHGIVINSVIESSSVPAGNTTGYTPQITYEYSVNRQMYSKTIPVGKVSNSDQVTAEKTLKKYYEGRLIEIFYNPVRPSDSLIKTFSATEKWLPVIGGSLLIIFGLLNIFYLKPDEKAVKDLQPRGIKTSQKPAPKPVSKTIHEITPGKKIPGINGKWKLNYQTPSMGEMIALANQPSGNAKTGDEIRSAGSDSILLTINGEKMSFNYNEDDINGSCEILSKFHLDEDKLMLEHQNIDFLLIDIDDFPPQYYTWSLKGSTLVLKTNKIKGLGDRQITYHFSKSEC